MSQEGTRRAPRHRRWARPRRLEAVAVAAFTLWVAWPFLSLGGYVTGYDTVTYSGPNLAFTFAELESGRLPVWNDTIFGGVNHLANGQAAVLYPLHWLFVPFPVARALEMISAAHLFVLAFGMFVLLGRRLQLRAPAAAIGSIVVVGGGAVMARSTQFEQLAVIAWVPWILAGVDAVICGRGRQRWRAVALTALAIAMWLLAGHPQQVYVTAPLLAGWAIVRALDATRGAGDRPGVEPRLDAEVDAEVDIGSGGDGDVEPAASGDGAAPGHLANPTPRGGAIVRGRARTVAVARRLGPVALAGLLGAGIAAPQLLVTAAQLPDTVTIGARTLDAASVPGYASRTELLVSTLLGNPLTEEPTTTAESFEALGFVGTTAFALALVGFAAAVANGRLRWTGGGAAALAVCAAVLALGPMCGSESGQFSCEAGGRIYRAAFRWVPGFSQARVPGRWLLVATFALAVLAALGVDAIVRSRLDRRALRVLAATIVATGLVGAATRPELPADASRRTVALWIVLAGAPLVVAVLAARLRPTRQGLRRGLPAAAIVLLTAGVVGDLGLAGAHSIARREVVGPAFDEMSGSTVGYLSGETDRVLSIAPNPLDDFGYLTRALKPNANEPYAIRTIDGYDGGLWVTRHWVTAMAALTPTGELDLDLPLNWQLATPLDDALLARFGVRFVVVDPVAAAAAATGSATPSAAAIDAARDARIPGWRGPVHREGNLEVWENPAFDGEAHLYRVTRPVHVEGLDTRGAMHAYSDALNAATHEEAVVPDTERGLACPEPATPDRCGATPVDVARPHPGAISADVDSPADGLLVVPEQAARGWRATVDGADAPIVVADGMSIGVHVPAGRHSVVLSYEAPGLPLGMVGSLASLVACAALLAPRRSPRQAR